MLRNLTKIMHTHYGQILISVILGLGLASLFRRGCSDKSCMTFRAPPPETIADNVYKHGDGCYRFEHASAPCNPNKTIVDIDREAADPASVRHS